jgi:hypothetical protein
VTNRLSWLMWPGLALLAACSMEQAGRPWNPASVESPEDVAAAVSASQASCTLTQGFWKNHIEAWPSEISIGGVTYTAMEAIQILSTPPRGDATYILAHQLIAAKLNVLEGADDSAVATTIVQADAWLVLHPLGSDPDGADREEGIALAEVLDEYNNGVIGPGHCDEPTPIPTPSPSPSPPPTTAS